MQERRFWKVPQVPHLNPADGLDPRLDSPPLVATWANVARNFELALHLGATRLQLHVCPLRSACRMTLPLSGLWPHCYEAHHQQSERQPPDGTSVVFQIRD